METEFKRGAPVILRLAEDLSYPGEKTHRATFVRYHPADSRWAEVELEEKHAGGTKTLHVPAAAIEVRA